jgi:hypothetical protein
MHRRALPLRLGKKLCVSLFEWQCRQIKPFSPCAALNELIFAYSAAASFCLLFLFCSVQGLAVVQMPSDSFSYCAHSCRWRLANIHPRCLCWICMPKDGHSLQLVTLVTPLIARHWSLSSKSHTQPPLHRCSTCWFTETNLQPSSVDQAVAEVAVTGSPDVAHHPATTLHALEATIQQRREALGHPPAPGV